MLQLYFYKRICKHVRFGYFSSGGRNFLGRVCVNGRIRGNKRLFTKIDFFRRTNQFGIIYKIIHDSRRTAFVGLVIYKNGLASYIILSSNFYFNKLIYSGPYILNDPKFILQEGWALPLKSLPLFSTISNMELAPFKGFQLARSAGVSGILVSKDLNFAYIKLNSKWQVKILLESYAVKGAVSNNRHNCNHLGSAGAARALGYKSKVRGVAKNPCDHPHGGGNGKKPKPVNPVTP